MSARIHLLPAASVKNSLLQRLASMHFPVFSTTYEQRINKPNKSA